MSTTNTNDQNNQGEDQNNQNNENGSPKTFTQADMDALAGKLKAEAKSKNETAIAEAIKAEREKWEAESKLTEAEREKKRDEEFKQHLADKEAELNRRDAINRAKELLSDKKIDQKFADFLIGETVEKTEERVADFVKIFDDAVQATTTERLKGNTPEKFTDKKTENTKHSVRTVSQHGRTGF